MDKGAAGGPPRLLRRRDGHEARVTFEELFFDLVYAFAVTQLSHLLLHHQTTQGAIQALILWFAVWLGWQYTCWITNWFDPERPAVRGLLFGITLLALLLAAALPEAFGERGMLFGVTYAVMQVGRTVFALCAVGADHPLAANFRRMMVWVGAAALFWIAGGLAGEGPRPWLWACGVACEYISPMFGFPVPGLGRSRTSEWTVEGAHMAERCQAFVLVALGETVIMTGDTLAENGVWSAPVILAFLTAFVTSLATWWLYFGTSGKDGSAAIRHSGDPGRMAAYFHYIHVILIAGIIVMAVGSDLVLAHPHGPARPVPAAIMAAGPVIFLLGSLLYKRVVYGCIAPSHLTAIAALVAGYPLVIHMDVLDAGMTMTAIMLLAGFWESRILRHFPAAGA
ncbi:low temperature requirement A [Gluconacetobacter diazotrophicus PA1 5]|uniref:Low temperature requirement protein A n=1 Tax=Gluconacetobacter diazotrophicus TaxID=33996 RepID=A0A7W4FDC1_GLUDI|nr:low temperature requirement protein A [Gluconacetobacter diazotrophicus]ACI50474.1 low temperature requirement A [Gluconacetobacter diazotrophicus PA1 5]MBB2155670.1 low temperature requirement protein A [Gluconacetobacter diazotrophicus]TWA98278.1 low temperature requirement protein LtrA [Gluconacetobacter diazotrophicus]